MEKGFITQFKGNHFCKSIVFIVCYVFLVQSCIWMMPPPSIRHYPAGPISPVGKGQGILSDLADAFRDAIDLFLPAKAYAAPLVADAGGPYIINEEAAQGGLWTVRFDGSNSSSTEGIVRYEWDFGDGYTLCTVGGKETVNFFASGMHLYGYDVADADLRIIASQDNTMVRIIDLQSALEINSAILNKYEQWENVGPGDGIYFKIEADKPVIAYETDMSWAHSAFVPSLEGGPVGREFIFSYFAGEGFYVFAIEDTILRMYQTDGTLISEQGIAAGSYWNPGLSNGIYHFISSGKISMQTAGGNAYTTVPSISGSGVGRKFYCATSAWLTGALAVFAYEDTQVSVYDLDSGDLLWTEDISKGSYWWKTEVGTRRLRIESTGDIEVWAGDTEQGLGISSLGDDISFAGGKEAKEFYVHGLLDGLVIFAPFDNTILSLDGQVETLSADGYLRVAGGAFHHITSNNPILIQTLGRANSYNDLGTYLGGVSDIVHQYIAPGSYTITLTVYDSAGQSATDTTSVQSTVGAPPMADPGGPYIFDESFVTEGKWTVVVNGIGSTDDYGICTYQWDFGDGGSGTGISPTHQYSATGTYTLTLTVTDYVGQTHTSTTTVTILDNDDPVPSIAAPETVGEENASLGCWSVDFDASGSTDDFGILRYEWDFGDGGTGTGQSITHSYCAAGTYTVTLTVYDHAGQSGSTTTIIRVQPGGLPVASAGGPYGPIESGQPVTFDGTGSTDDFGITEYFWDFGEFIHTFDGTQIDYAQWAAPPQVIQDNEIILTGADIWGTRYFFSRHPCHRGSVLEAVIKTPTTNPQLFMIGFKSDNPIYHYNQMPYAVYFFGGSIYVYEDGTSRWQRSYYTYGLEYEVRIELKKDAGALYYFRERGTSDWNLIYDSNYGNLKSLRIGADVHSGSFAVDDIKLINHAYGPTSIVPIFQDQAVTLTVTDNAGQTDSETPDVDVVIGDPPQAEIVAQDHLDLGIEGTFSASLSTDDYGITAHLWDFGDGSTAEGRIVYHFYSSVGTYTVTLKVYDHAGQFDIATKTIDVSGENLVVCVPWQIVGGVEVPHDTWSGNEAVLKAVAKSAATPIEYTWDFGDGTSESGTITDASDRFVIEARHIYTGSAGEPFVATITITDDTGITASDTYRLIIRPKTLEIEENVAIDNGLWWLYKNQIRDIWPSGTYRDAPVEYSYWRSYEAYSASSTASVVQAFLINGHIETGDPIEDPYVETVRRGMRYVFTTLNHVNIGPQTYGDPDTNGNGIGLQVDSFRPIYEGGMVMDAIAATGTPDAIARTGRANVRGRTYQDIMIDMVDMYAWGQNDGGGWRYSWNADSDNSAAQWGAIGLLAAEEIFGITIPQWVKERNDVWLNYSYDGIGFGYTGRGHGVGQTPSGMIQLAFCDRTTSDSRWQTSEDWIANNWAWWLNQNNIYACYAFAKAMRTAQPQEVVTLSATEFDWFNDEHQGLARYLMDLQETDLGWPNLYFSESKYPIGRTFSAAWSIIILTRTLFVKPPVALIHASPNPGAIGREIRFDASASYHLDPFRSITGYQWDFDVSDGLDWEHPDATGRITTHTFGELGDYTVTLRVLDNNVPVRMDTDIVIISITIPPHSPTANADGPYIAATGESITLDGSGSYDIDESEGDSITAYGWEIDMVAPKDFDDATGVSPTVSGYDTAGTYPIGLRVSDNTEDVFPSSGSPNLTDDDFTEVIVYNRCINDLYARPKGTKASLVWTHMGADEYKVYRSEKGPNIGMELIGTTNSTYSTYIDYNVELNKDYWYRVQVEDNIQICGSYAYHINSQGRIRNMPPKITSTPILTARETQLYAYDMEADDPDGQTITYLLDQAPDGMNIAESTGLIEWIPVFSQIGPNEVTIRAMDALGASSAQFFIIVVSPRPNEPPIPDPGGPYSSLRDQEITFDSSGSYDPEGDLPLTYEWNFGDGTTSAEKNPVHIYTASGLYIVTLFVTDSRGATGSAETTAQIDEPNRPPTADIGGPYTGHAQAEISFDGSGSYDPDGDPLTYAWDFGDSTAPVTGVTVMHIYETEGTYNVSLTVDDDRGGIDTDSVDVVISPPNEPPDAGFTGSNFGNVGDEFTFDASSSTDPDGEIVSYEWDFDDGSTTRGMIVTHVFDTPGHYMVSLTVTDDDAATDTATLAVHINAPPEIVSAPKTTAIEDSLYTYDIDATDGDGDILTYSLTEALSGMTIDSATGLIRWTPAQAQVGDNFVTVSVNDGKGGTGTQSFVIVVQNINDAPVITSSPVTTAIEETPYTYDVEATDEDGDTLTYSLTTSPTGMTIDISTGLIQWTPGETQAGSHTVEILVTDGQGASATQSYTLTVSATNSAPRITSTPVTTATQDQPYTYDVEASDPDGDSITFSLDTAPSGMTIAPDTGLIQWTPGSTQTGANQVVVAVSDNKEAVTTQIFTINVQNVNDPPEITSTPITITNAKMLYTYDVEASDVDGDNVLYSLDISPPAMTIDSDTGLIRWTPAESDLGDHTIRVRARDPSGAFDTQEYTLTVQQIIDNTPPRVTNIIIDPSILNPGETATITIDAVDNIMIGSYELQVDGVDIPLVGNTATYTAATIGIHEVEATVCDISGNCDTLIARFGVHDPGDTTPPDVSITSPATDSELTAPKDLIGTASDENLVSYTLEYSEKDKNNFIQFYKGHTEVLNDVLGSLDPTLLVNGLYDIRLSAIDVNGLTNSDMVTYRITGNLKIGNFTVTFNDLEIPVAGIPITIYRTYDSRIRHNIGDFGYGWNIDIRTTKVEENREPGDGWYQQSSEGFFPTYFLFPDGEHYVSITLPDGQVLEFDCKFTPESQFIIPITWVNAVVYTPRPGTNGSLVALDDSPMYFDGSQVLNGDLEVYNPDQYQLTTIDGTVYIIYQTEGLKKIIDNNGNSLDITPGGIFHSSGKSLTFTRDAQGRITEIIDPMENSILYEYDLKGDLIAFTDQEGNTSQYTYNSNHGLVDIFDPTGNRPIRNEYDYDGRLIAHIDAEGNRVEYTHDPDSRQEIISDRLSNITVFEYDDEGNVTKKTDPLGNETAYSYDDRGNKLSETDPLGNTTTYTYDNQDNMLTETDPLGNTTSNTYNARGQVLTTTDPLGNVTTNTYDSNGNLLTTTDPLGNTTTNSYDAKGNLTSTTDPLGNVTSYTYDSSGNMLTQTDPLGNITTYTYDNNGNQLTQTSTLTTPYGSETITTANVYDSLNRLVKTIDPYGNSTITQYNPIGKQSATIDKNGNRIEYEYDSRGNLIKTTYPDGTIEIATYDAEKRKTSSTDRAGKTTLYIYDDLGRLIQTIYPDGSSTKTTFSCCRIASQTDERGNTTTYIYDVGGRKISITDPLGNTITYTYDASGNQLTMTDANGNTYIYKYDENNRRIRANFPDSTFTSITYDAFGRKVTETDQAGITTQFEYDALGRLIKVTDTLDQETTYTYDELSNKIYQTDANGHTTTWEYDRLGRVTKRTLPLGMSETMTYDAAGNLISKTDFNGDTITYTYDNNNRLILKIYPDSSTISFSYTPSGQRASILESHGLTAFVYDVRDRLLQRTDPDGTVISYTYDAAGNRTSVNVPSGTTTYTLDSLNRLVTVTDPDAGVTAYTYDAVGNRTSVTYPNSTRAVYIYNTLNRLVRLENRRSDSSIISSYVYTLGPSGNRIRVQENINRVVDYTYDVMYRLTEESITDPSLGNRIITYSYDPVGNRLSKGDSVEGPTNYTYDENDRLLTENGISYTYDNNGNTISKTEGSDVTTYSYDFENRLIGTQTPTALVNYTYNPCGIRVSSMVNGIVTNYLVDMSWRYAQVLEERDLASTLIVSYIYGDDLISMVRGGVASFYHYDGNGNTRQLTDSMENIKDTYVYDAFGIMLERTGTTENNYLYTGEQYDSNVGFYYLRSRYYNPELGRFLSVDPFIGFIFDPKSLHKYIYTHNDPVNRIDPSGEQTIVLPNIMMIILLLILFSALTRVPPIPLPRIKRPCFPCRPYPSGTKLNKDTHIMHDHARCLEKTGSMIHWHYDKVNQDPSTCRCFVNHHRFGGCGCARPPFIYYYGPVW